LADIHYSKYIWYNAYKIAFCGFVLFFAHWRSSSLTSHLGAFIFLLAVAGYAGLSSIQIDGVVNDKVLHLITFFILTTSFYWILDTSRRRTLHLTFIVCTLILGVGSEFLQAFLPNDRTFDLFDIVANDVGSVLAIGLCSWYHNRMLERKRLAKNYHAVPGEGDLDLELGEEAGPQESGTTNDAPARTVEEELDNWDENAEDAWDEEEHAAGTDEGESLKTPSASSAGDADGDKKKRADWCVTISPVPWGVGMIAKAFGFTQQCNTVSYQWNG
jgi:VanZ family protein